MKEKPTPIILGFGAAIAALAGIESGNYDNSESKNSIKDMEVEMDSLHSEMLQFKPAKK